MTHTRCHLFPCMLIAGLVLLPVPAEAEGAMSLYRSHLLNLGLGLELGIYLPDDVNQEIEASLPKAYVTKSGFTGSVLLLGLGLNFEVRPVKFLGLGVCATYLMGPKIINIEGEGMETFNAQAGMFGGWVRGYLPVGRKVSLVLGGTPAVYVSKFSDHVGTGFGVVSTFGVEISPGGLVSPRILGYFRWAPIRTDEDFVINFTGGGVQFEVEFGWL